MTLKHLIAEHHNEHHCHDLAAFVSVVVVVMNAVVVVVKLFLFRVVSSIDTAGVMTKYFSKRLSVTVILFRVLCAATVRSVNHLDDSSLPELSSGLTI